MERFIESVRQYPCLWKVSTKEYRNLDTKEAAWQSIVDDLNSDEIKDVKEAKSEWKKLRDNHRDSLKRMKTTKSGQAAANINPWKYAENMEFLLPYMKTRSRSTNLNYSNTQSLEMPETFDVQDDENANNSEISVLSNDIIDNTEAAPQGCRTETRKRNAEGEMEQNQEKRQEDRDLKRTMASGRKEKEAIDLFLESMAITIKTMPTWMQNRVKKKIFHIVSDAEEEIENYNIYVTPDFVNNILPAAGGSTRSTNFGYSKVTSINISPSTVQQ